MAAAATRGSSTLREEAMTTGSFGELEENALRMMLLSDMCIRWFDLPYQTALYQDRSRVPRWRHLFSFTLFISTFFAVAAAVGVTSFPGRAYSVGGESVQAQLVLTCFSFGVCTRVCV